MTNNFCKCENVNKEKELNSSTCPVCGNLLPIPAEKIMKYPEGPVWVIPLYPITGVELVAKPQYAIIALGKFPSDADLVVIGGLFGTVTWRLSDYNKKWVAYPIAPTISNMENSK